MKDICYNQKFITPELDLKEATLLFTKDETMLIVGRKLMKLSKYSSSVAHKIEDFDNKGKKLYVVVTYFFRKYQRERK